MPLTEAETDADLASVLALPIVLVVGLRLGCLNHALLTAEAIRRRGLDLAGWIPNRIDPDMQEPDDNIAYLKTPLGQAAAGRHPALRAAQGGHDLSRAAAGMEDRIVSSWIDEFPSRLHEIKAKHFSTRSREVIPQEAGS